MMTIIIFYLENHYTKHQFNIMTMTAMIAIIIFYLENHYAKHQLISWQ